MHLLLLTPGFPKDNDDSANVTYLQNLIKEISDTCPDLSITIYTLQYPFVKTTYTWNSVIVKSFGGKNKRNLFAKLALWINVIYSALLLNKKTKIDHVHSFWLKECSFLGWIISIFLKKPLSVTAMGTEVTKEKNKYLMLIPLSKIPIVCVSAYQAKILVESYSDIDPIIIPFGLKSRTELTENIKRDIQILSVGHLNAGKDLYSFIDTIAKMKSNGGQIENVVIIGEDLSNGKIDDYIIRKKLKGIVTLTGQLSNSEVINHMLRSRVLLHTSIFESQGYVFLEALSCGLTIVSRKVGIAEQSKRWLVADSTSDFASLTTQALDQTDQSSLIPYPIRNTVTSYVNLWKDNSE